MEKTRIRKVFFKKLKGLNDVEISFSDTLTAIMGVNGSGKTTVIHALACIYQPDGKGENHRFPEFFVPNTDSLWNGSDFEVVNETEDNRRQRVILPSREYSKFFDRWSPHYDRRPKRNVYYLGIDTCLPDIEKTSAPRIIYHSLDRTDRQATKTIEYSSYILNKSYRHLLDNTYYNKHFTGVQLESGLKYSSLSMGSGEQRVIKIISVLLAAEPFSLVLIDEIDLLLHVSALKRLIEIIHDIAVRKNIQVVFTTHSLEMIQLSRYVSIQYIHNLGEGKPSTVYKTITPDLIYSMTGQTHKTHRVYVEDNLAKYMVYQLVRKKQMSTYVDIIKYGAIENAFTIASGLVIQNEQTENILILLDGDRYRSTEEKKEQIKKKLSGTEDDAEEKRAKTLSMISEFSLPDDTSPEKFLHDIILRCFPDDNEIYDAANEIQAVGDSHEWVSGICDRLGVELSSLIQDVFTFASEDEEFIRYIHTIEDWIESHRPQ